MNKSTKCLKFKLTSLVHRITRAPNHADNDNSKQARRPDIKVAKGKTGRGLRKHDTKQC